MQQEDDNRLTFGDHLEVLRHMLFRVIGIVSFASILFFCFKEFLREILLAPSENSFCLYNWIEDFLSCIGYDFMFESFDTDLISTELGSQFMVHLTASIGLGLVFSAPYILFEVFKYISPALYANEQNYAKLTLTVVYLFFTIGLLLSYFVIFPLSYRFLSTFSISEKIHTTVTIDSYISSFTTTSLLMGLFFQLPIITYLLARYEILTVSALANYRKHALIIIMFVAAIITPPDIMTLLIVTLPLYALFEASLFVMKFAKK